MVRSFHLVVKWIVLVSFFPSLFEINLVKQMSDLELFSEVEWNAHLNLGLGYECTLLCNRVLCHRLFSKQSGDGVAEIIQYCSPDTSVSGYDHTVWTPK